jgi:hypothetical protein
VEVSSEEFEDSCNFRCKINDAGNNQTLTTFQFGKFRSCWCFCGLALVFGRSFLVRAVNQALLKDGEFCFFIDVDAADVSLAEPGVTIIILLKQ